jgi:predicted enzyme related to lactoylglutathione lyase
MGTNAGAKAGVENAVPILRVRNLAASIDFYTKVLGFRVDWGGESGIMASVSRDRGSLMLCQGDQGNAGTWVWIGVEDADALHRELSAAGAKIPLPPTNYPWALEFHVQDPDGHVLRFGSEPREDRPFSEWVAWYRAV